MSHSVMQPASTVVVPVSARSIRKPRTPSLVSVRARVDDRCPRTVLDDRLVHRRNVGLGLAGAMLGLVVVGGERDAVAARRPPPPPPEEKKDLNVSGVQAKVIASKKRKEAMKQEMAKLREKGKAINSESPPPE